MKNNNLPDNAIEITDLTKIYKNNNEEDLIALNSVNLEIPRGKKVALVGLSGSGKSTIANIILRFFENYKGDICINSKNIREIQNHL